MAIFSNPGLYQIPAGKNEQLPARAIISVKIKGTANTFPVVVTECDGGVQVNHQNVQDFLGNNYLTVFGRSVSDFKLVCAEATDCSGKTKTNGIVEIANSIKNATSVGNIPQVTVTYKGLTIIGALIGMSFNLDLPYQTFTLHVIGTQQ